MSANKEPSEQNFLSSIKVSFWTFSSRIFGLLRDISTTNLFGASLYHDIFVVVLRIPNLFRRFFAEGAFNQAFVPILSDIEKTKDPKQVKDFIDSLAGILISTLFVFVVNRSFFLLPQNIIQVVDGQVFFSQLMKHASQNIKIQLME